MFIARRRQYSSLPSLRQLTIASQEAQAFAVSSVPADGGDLRDIEDLDWFGLAHSIIGIAAMVSGVVVMAISKGTATHRLCGAFYVVAMVLLNASALAIYDFSGGFNTFHVFAILSLMTVVAGWVPALLRRRGSRWHLQHARYMAWSYVGLVAAFAAEIATRLPPFRSGRAFGIAVGGATLAVIAAGAVLIQRHVPQAVSRLRVAPSSQPVLEERASIKQSSND